MRSRASIFVLLVLTARAGAVGPAGAAPANDDFANATTASSLPFHETTSTVGATLQHQEPQPACGTIGATVWYRVVPDADTTLILTTSGSSFDTILAVYIGDRLNKLEEVSCSDDGGSSEQAVLTLTAAAAQTYFVQIGGFGGKTGSLDLTIRTPTPGDDFDAAVVVDSLPFNDSRNTEDATMEPGEPTPCGLQGHSIWYRFTPGATATIDADTFGSDYDTVLAVYTGNSLSDLTFVACNDQFQGNQSRVTVQTLLGQTYYIQAGGFFGDSGNLSFHIQAIIPPANDAFTAAVEVAGLPYMNGQNTFGASLEPEEPQACGATSTVWYRFTPIADALVTIDTLGSDFDTVLAVYTGPSVDDLSLVTCNDDLVGLASGVAIESAAGETYHIQVGGFFGSSGNLVLHILGLG